jgi:hypothetical protein
MSGVADQITAEEVVDVLARQPGNRGKSREVLESWVVSQVFKLTAVYVALRNLGVSPGKTGQTRSAGQPIIVDENIHGVARPHEEIGGPAPDYLVLDGQNRVVAARGQNPRGTIQAYVGDQIFDQLNKENVRAARELGRVQEAINEYLSVGGSVRLDRLRTYAKQGLVLPRELDTLREKRREQARGVGDLFPEDFFPKVRELSPEEKAESEARTKAWRFLESQQPGQLLKVGRHKFVIWRSRGSEVFMTKAGSKGRKLFKLEVSSFHPVTFDVVEVSGGSGTSLGKPPIARFQP